MRIKTKIRQIMENPGLINTDSRQIKKGDIFVALKGDRFNGHDFVREAFRRGARLAVVSRKYDLPAEYMDKAIRVDNTVKFLGKIAQAHRSRFNIPVIAVTGSNGKTTAKEMAYYVLSAGYSVLKSENSNNNFIGLPLALLKLEKRHRIAIIEMGMNHRGEIRKLCKIAKPTMGVVTNIGPCHLKFLKSLGNVFRAKSELLDYLGTDSLALLNTDDRYLGRVGRLKCRKIYFGIERKCDFRAKNLVYKSNKWFFSLGRDRDFELGLLGRHNIYNALIAIALARQFGLSFSAIRKRIKSFRKSCPMRLELKKIRGIEIIDDSYNSNPIAMKRAAETLAKYKCAGKRILVSGDMLELGKKWKMLHEEAGRNVASSRIDVFITLGRMAKLMNKGARKGGMKRLYHARTHGDAANVLRKTARRGDMVLVKGSRVAAMEKVIEKFRRKVKLHGLTPRRSLSQTK